MRKDTNKDSNKFGLLKPTNMNTLSFFLQYKASLLVSTKFWVGLDSRNRSSKYLETSLCGRDFSSLME